MSEVMSPVPKDDPLMIAWEAFKATPAYENSKGWAMQIAPLVHAGDPDREAKRRFDLMPREQRERHVEGSLWAAFMAGFLARPAQAAELLTRAADILEREARALKECHSRSNGEWYLAHPPDHAAKRDHDEMMQIAAGLRSLLT